MPNVPLIRRNGLSCCGISPTSMMNLLNEVMPEENTSSSLSNYLELKMIE